MTSPNPIPLGVVKPGQVRVAEYAVFNPSAAPLTVEQVETSSRAVKSLSGPIRVEPAESRAFAIEFDPSDDPKFRGGLNVEILGRGGGGTLFKTYLAVEVAGEACP